MDESAALPIGHGPARGWSDRQQFGDLVINRVERRVLVGDCEVQVTPSEFRLLSTLAAEPQRAFSSRELLEAMWESPWRSSTAPLQIHVSRLRKKLATAGAERSFLTTIHGFGYRFDPGLELAMGPTGAGDADGRKFPDESPTTEGGSGTVRLSFDHEFILREVSPHAAFLGFDPDTIIGTFFSPAGLTRDQMDATIRTLMIAGHTVLDSEVTLFDASGQAVRPRVVSRLVLSDEQEFLGLESTIALPDSLS